MEFIKVTCFLAICLMFLAGNSMGNPVDDAQDRGVASLDHRQKCPYPRGQFPHLWYCDWFYNCWDGQVFEQQCPRGLVFNPRCQYCDYPANVDCGGKIIFEHTPANAMCPTPNGVFPDPWDCSYFVLCAGGRGTRQVCPAGLLFNPTFYGCDYPQNVKCQTQAPQCSNGYYPHTNCQSFWSCSNQHLDLKYCPAGQQFDMSCGQCKDEQLVQCHASTGAVYGRSASQNVTDMAQD